MPEKLTWRERRQRRRERKEWIRLRDKGELPGRRTSDADMVDLLYGDFHEECGDR